MSTTADVLPIGITAQAVRELRRERWQGRVSRAAGTLNLLGIGWTVPLMRLALGDTPRAQVAELWRTLFVPVIAIIIELRETEIDALIHKGLLTRDNSQNSGAIIAALYDFLDRTLDTTP